MNQIWKNDNLFELLRTEISILSSQITGFNIHVKDFSLIIEVDIKLLYGKEECLKLIFSDIKEYAFYHNSNYTFYNVEAYKLLKKENLFYISFDPEEEDISNISKDDNDLILCGDIEGYFIEAPLA